MKTMMMCLFLLCSCTQSYDVQSADAGSSDTYLNPPTNGYTLAPVTGTADTGTQVQMGTGPAGENVSIIGAWSMPLALALPPGSITPQITADLRDNAPSCSGCYDGVAFNVMLVSYVGSNWTVLATATSAGSGTWQTLTLTPPSHIVAANETMRLRYYTWSQLSIPTRMSDIGMVHVATPLRVAAVPCGIASLPGTAAGSAFELLVGAPTLAGSTWTFEGGATGRVGCVLSLPVGTTISHLVWSFARSSPFYVALELRLTKRNSAGQTFPVYDDVLLGSIGASHELHDSIPSAGGPYAIEAGYSYELSFQADVPGPFFSSNPTFDAVSVQ